MRWTPKTSERVDKPLAMVLECILQGPSKLSGMLWAPIAALRMPWNTCESFGSPSTPLETLRSPWEALRAICIGYPYVSLEARKFLEAHGRPWRPSAVCRSAPDGERYWRWGGVFRFAQPRSSLLRIAQALSRGRPRSRSIAARRGSDFERGPPGQQRGRRRRGSACTGSDRERGARPGPKVWRCESTAEAI